MVTPATRHELKRSVSTAFTGYLVKPLRAASLVARLTLPPERAAPDLVSDELATLEPLETPASLPSARLSVLVAEDNEINALLMRSLLNRLGHRAVIATNGEEALESWLAAESAGAPYDVVLMDIQMPKLDGIETTRQIRAREAGQRARRTPVLALTANTLVEDRYACFEAGMDGFLVKPLDRDKLAEALKHWRSVERDARSGGISFFEGMRLLAGADFGDAPAQTNVEEVRQWSSIVHHLYTTF